MKDMARCVLVCLTLIFVLNSGPMLWAQATGYYATVGGGLGNSASGSYATVAGGVGNTASGNSSAISGGESNVSTNDHSAVAGGYLNLASGANSAVAGGGGNNATGNFSFVGGGFVNQGNGIASSVLGGFANTAGGNFSAVPGGAENVASGFLSFAAGCGADTNNQNGAFVWGDGGCGTLKASAANQFMVRASGGVVFYTNANLSSGVQLAAGAGSWSSLSDRNVKDHLVPIDTQALLTQVAALPITTWNYKSQAASIRHIGPMAQDFFAAFKVGEDDHHITEIDEGGVALAAIQGLNQKLEKLEEDVRQLRAQLQEKDTLLLKQQQQIDALERQMNTMMARVQAVESNQAGAAPIRTSCFVDRTVPTGQATALFSISGFLEDAQ